MEREDAEMRKGQPYVVQTMKAEHFKSEQVKLLADIPAKQRSRFEKSATVYSVEAMTAALKC